MGIDDIVRQYLQTSSLMVFVFVFIAGVVTSFTPCIYPMIPIIVGYIGGRKEKSRLKSFTLSLSYVVGMAATYSALGAFAALTGQFFGQIQTHYVTNLIVGNIIILLGLSMLGVFTLPIPKFLSGPTGVRKKRDGLFGALSLGFASGFVAAPCTAAVLAVLMTYVAKRQNIILGMSLLFSFALGMGFLLLLIGTFTGIMTALPKSGVWMERVQKAFGWFMIILGEYFLILAGKGMM